MRVTSVGGPSPRSCIWSLTSEAIEMQRRQQPAGGKESAPAPSLWSGESPDSQTATNEGKRVTNKSLENYYTHTHTHTHTHGNMKENKRSCGALWRSGILPLLLRNQKHCCVVS